MELLKAVVRDQEDELERVDTELRAFDPLLEKAKILREARESLRRLMTAYK